MSGTIHPYYLSKAEDVLAEQRFDADADPTPLAAWAQDAPPGAFAYATSDGSIVGTGVYSHGRLFTVGHADEATVARYGLRSARRVWHAAISPPSCTVPSFWSRPAASPAPPATHTRDTNREETSWA